MTDARLKLAAASLIALFAAFNAWVMNGVASMGRQGRDGIYEDIRAYKKGRIDLQRVYPPDFDAPLNGGGNVSLSSVIGKNAVLLYFLDPKDKAGRTGLKELARFHTLNKGPGFMVIAVVPAGAEKEGALLMKEYGAQFPLAMDADGKLFSLYRVIEPPATVYIGPDGKIKSEGRWRGFQPVRSGFSHNMDMDYTLELRKNREEIAMNLGITRERYLKNLEDENQMIQRGEEDERKRCEFEKTLKKRKGSCERGSGRS